jgi:TonB family protein
LFGMIKWMFLAAAAAAVPVAAACYRTASQPEGPVPARLIAGSISNADYPPAAIAAGEQGTTAVRIMVGADGAVTGCDVEASSGSEALDTTSCALITERLRYAPARDAAGVATPSVVRTRIAWRLQTGTPGTPARFAFQSFWTTYTAKLEGRIVRSCSTHSVGTSPATVPDDICARLFHSFLPWAEQRGGLASLTQVVAFTVAGQSPPPVQPHWGQVLVRADADVTIGPDGGNAGCVVTRVERAPDAGPLGPADPCSLSGGGGSVLFEPARNGAAPREGRALIATFAERGPAEAR